MSEPLVEAMINMKVQETFQLAEKMLHDGEDPMRILDLCREAVEIIGKQFEEGKYFLPELVLSGKMLKTISKMAEPYLTPGAEAEREHLGKVVIGTVKGDIHDIGKDIVVFLLDAHGFDVHDLGVDVPPHRFVEAIEEIQPAVVGMSALLTLAFEAIKSTVDAIKEAGIRDRVKIMIGGGLVTESVRVFSGADAYGEDAAAAVSIAKEWTKNG